MSGLCHKSQVAEQILEEKEMQELYKKGDFVKVIVLKKNAEKQQLSLGMKPRSMSRSIFTSIWE